MDLNDKKLAYALTALRGADHFQTVKDAIQAMLDRKRRELPYVMDERQTRIAQGGCQELERLLDDFEKAAEVYERLQKKEV